MTQNILFLCPHAAAKSVLAMTYFDDLATKAGLDVQVSNAGTEPDPTIHPEVDALLKSEGLPVGEFVPPLLTDSMLADADMIVSLGCIDAEQSPKETRFLDWSDVPMLSDGFQLSRDTIYAHVVELIEELSNA